MDTALTQKAFPLFSGNWLKILAAVAMTADHIGLVLLPGMPVLRYIGRLAFPVFAFMIAEGCAHTRHPGRYFLSVLGLGVVCQTAYTAAMNSWLLCVPLSFAIAIALVFTLDSWKRALFGEKLLGKLKWSLLLALAVPGTWAVSRHTQLDYGFWGCMMPVAASLFRRTEHGPLWLERLDRNLVHVLMMGLCMVPLALELGPWQWWSFLALPVLNLYSGQRGRVKMKYFFYIFYPAHLLAIQGLHMLLG